MTTNEFKTTEEFIESNETVEKQVVITAQVKVTVPKYSWHNEEIEKKIREALMIGTKDFDGDVVFDYNIAFTHI
jgi:hypothetical protein